MKTIYFILLFLNLIAFFLSDRSKTLKILCLLIVVILIVEAVGFSARQFKFNRFFIYHLYRPIHFLIIALLYRSHFTAQKMRLAIDVATLLFFILCYSYSFLLGHYRTATSLTSTIESFLILSLVIFYFVNNMVLEKYVDLKSEPLFWISCGLLIFYAGTLFTMGFQAYLQQASPTYGKALFKVNYYLSYLLYTLTLIAFLCRKIFRKSFSSPLQAPS